MTTRPNGLSSQRRRFAFLTRLIGHVELAAVQQPAGHRLQNGLIDLRQPQRGAAVDDAHFGGPAAQRVGRERIEDLLRLGEIRLHAAKCAARQQGGQEPFDQGECQRRIGIHAREVEEGGLRGPGPPGGAVLVAEQRKGPRQLMQVPLDRPARDGVPLVAELSLHASRCRSSGAPVAASAAWSRSAE